MARADKIELYPPDCPVCYSEDPCDCYEWAARWESLTPEQRRSEEQSMAEYGGAE